MVLLAISDWQLVAYAAPVVFVLVIFVLALLKWSAPAPDSRQDNKRTAEPSTASSRDTGAAAGTVNSAGPLRSARDFVSCPECSRHFAQSKLHRHRQEAHGTVRHCPLCNQYIRSGSLQRHNSKKHGVKSAQPLKLPTLQCPRCHNSVLKKNICSHLRRAHQINFTPACGWHPVDAAMHWRRDDFWLIDGLNIVRIQGKDAPRFDFLLALTHHMLNENIDFLCVFDASARPCIRELQGTYFAELCEQLIRSCPLRFSEVPSRTIADEAILDIATMLGPRIITNDLFRDHAQRYPWLENDGEARLCGVQFRNGPQQQGELLVWEGNTIRVPAPRSIRSFVGEYKQLLTECEANRSSAVAAEHA